MPVIIRRQITTAVEDWRRFGTQWETAIPFIYIPVFCALNV